MWSCLLLPLILFSLVTGALRGDVRLIVINGRPVVEGVYVNGNGPYRFLVDTGASVNHLEPELARALGLTPTFRTELTSSMGTAIVPGISGLAVALGDARAEEQQFLFAGMEIVHGLSTGIRGILGQSFLGHFDYRLDLRHKRLMFGTQQLAGQRAGMKTVAGRIVVATSLGALVLDSGTAHVALFGVNAVSTASNYMRTLAGSDTVSMISSLLAIDGKKVWRGEAVALPKRTETGVDGLMPVSLFRSVYVCNSEGYIVFE